MSFPVTMATCAAIFFNIASWWMMQKHYKKAGFFNPISIFFAVWLLNLIGYEADGYLQYFCYRLSTKADVWLTLTFVFFFLGAWLAVWLRPKKSRMSELTQYSFNRLRYSTLFFLSLFIFAVLYKYSLLAQHYHGLIGHLGQIKEDIFNHKFHFPFVLYFFTLPEYLVGINLGILTVLNRQKFAILLSILALVLAYCNASFSGMRGGFLNYFLLYFSGVGFAFVATHKIKMRHYLYLLSILVSLFLLLGISLYVRSSYPHNADKIMKNYVTSIENQTIKQEQLLYKNYRDPVFIKGFTCLLEEWQPKEPIRSSMAETLYVHNFVYFVGPLPAYGYFLEYPWESEYWGKWTFYGIYSAVKEVWHALHLPDILIHLNEKAYYAPIIVGPFNSTNYLTYIFSDFGFAGLIILPFIFGFIANRCFLRVIDTKKINYMQFTSILCAGLIMSIRGLITNGVYFWVTIALIIWQNRYINLNRNKKQLM